MSARQVGRYRLFDEFAAGGMASLHFGRLSGHDGFSRLVAIKRLHPQFAKDPEFVQMFMEEARVASRIQHPNAVGVLDVVREEKDIFLVMDYVHGESLSKLIRRARKEGEKVPCAIACAVVAQMLYRLHAAHEALGENGKPLEIVHRDVSPQNVMVGVDGVARVVDFGIAKALGRSQNTVEGQLKGKLGYFSPEQLKQEVDRRTDVFAAAIVLWEALRAERLFTGDNHWEIAQAVMSLEIPDPSAADPEVPRAVVEVVLRGLSRDPASRFPTARAMAQALEKSTRLASTSEIADWVERLAGPDLERLRDRLAATDDLADVAPPPSRRGVSEEVATTVATPKAIASIAHEEAQPVAPTPPVAETPALRPPSGAAATATAIVLGFCGVGFGAWTLAKSQYERPTPDPLPRTESSSAAQEKAPVERSATVSEAQPSRSAPLASASASASASPPGPWPAAAKPRVCHDDRQCSGAERCVNGVCTCAREDLCNGACPNKSRDIENCGTCGNKCDGPSPRCQAGNCRSCDTAAGFEWCADRCVFLKNDPLHCGQCGTRCETTCLNGKCLR